MHVPPDGAAVCATGPSASLQPDTSTALQSMPRTQNDITGTAYGSTEAPPSAPSAPPAASAPAAQALDPELIRALEQQLGALAKHQESLMEQIQELNSSIAGKDAQIAELSDRSKKAGSEAAAEEAASREVREKMALEMAALRSEVARMQSQINHAASLSQARWTTLVFPVRLHMLRCPQTTA